MKRWLDSWSINEDEPSWANVVAAGSALVLIGIAAYFWIVTLGSL